MIDSRGRFSQRMEAVSHYSHEKEDTTLLFADLPFIYNYIMTGCTED